jgi:hypothetical protein
MTDAMTIYKIEDKDKNKDKDIFYKKASNQKLDLKALDSHLLHDENWLLWIVENISINNPSFSKNDLDRYLRQFFGELRIKGAANRTVQDCKNYFFNWLKIQLKNFNNYGKYKIDKRRGADVTATSPDDYEGPF